MEGNDIDFIQEIHFENNLFTFYFDNTKIICGLNESTIQLYLPD